MSSGALQGKLVLVTGASRGVGAHVVAAFAACGARVVAGARSFSDDTEDAPEMLAPGTVAKLHLDVTDEASVTRCFERLDAFGALDVLVNNAGIGAFAPVAELTRADVERTWATNTLGAFSCARHAFDRMRNRGGRIINIGSIAGAAALAAHPLLERRGKATPDPRDLPVPRRGLHGALARPAPILGERHAEARRRQ